MRKTCRWLGCAVLLCVTTMEFSGCQSRSLTSSLRFPGRKVRDSSVAAKEEPSKLNADRASDLLAEAREYEKNGDFPNATRAYREYLSSGGEPIKASRNTVPGQIAGTERKSRERTASVEKESDVDDASRLPTARKSPLGKIRQSDNSALARETSLPNDPWATSPADSIDENPTPESHAVDADKVAVVDEATRVSPEDIEELMDIDDGAIDWGEEPDAEESVAQQEIPEIDFNAPTNDEVNQVAVEQAAEVEAAVAAGPLVEDESATNDLNAETQVASAESSDEFAVPVLDSESAGNHAVDDREEVAATTGRQSTISVLCKDCEPWVYAQAMKLESLDPEVRKEGLTQLADMGTAARPAAAAVRLLLQDPEPLVQAHAAWALWRVDEDPWESVRVLTPLLNHTDVDVIEMACYILGDIGAPAESGITSLELLRDHAEGTTQVQAAEALIRIRGVDDSSLRVLTNSLRSRDGEERWIAAIALGRCRGDRSADAVAALTDALKDVDPEVRSAAALSLGAFGKEASDATDELQRVAHSDKAQVREAAIAALACMNKE